MEQPQQQEEEEEDEDEDEDKDARQQLEGLHVLYNRCRQFWLGTQATEEAAAEAVAAAAAVDTTTSDTGTGTSAAGFPSNSLPLAAAMMLDRWALLLHPRQPSCVRPKVCPSGG